ncbi:hypothetical protein [Paenibacillus xylanexedens]|uniref:hypothetical protein n=1 Tax=Paenibacillus xylanexedens TaxID=528191 RepID=UPI0011A1F593|nr:hypothetical protein [Paenibacillus xylanexedens]
MITQPASTLAARKNSVAAVSPIAPLCGATGARQPSEAAATGLARALKPRLAEQQGLGSQAKQLPSGLARSVAERGSLTDGLQPTESANNPARSRTNQP